MFSSRMSLNQSSLLYGQLEDLQELAFIERPIRRSLKVFLHLSFWWFEYSHVNTDVVRHRSGSWVEHRLWCVRCEAMKVMMEVILWHVWVSGRMISSILTGSRGETHYLRSMTQFLSVRLQWDGWTVGSRAAFGIWCTLGHSELFLSLLHQQPSVIILI